jgi:alcohol dehydrogenase (cytochrome c)
MKLTNLRINLFVITFALLSILNIAQSQTQQELINDGNKGTTDNVLTYGMGYHQQRYSPLKKINKNNVKKLKFI